VRYPRSSGYEAGWVVDNQMGPHPLWLLESLLEVLDIDAGARVLDLGCGRAMTSIFLARETGARVWATDLWISATENQRRIEAAGVAGGVTAIHADARSLPYAAGTFDVIVSIDAYQYFGTDDLYLGSLVELLRPGGRLGIVVPGLTREIGADVPEHLRPHWDWQFGCFHSPEWWRVHWAKTGKVAVDRADLVDGGWRDWQRFNDAVTPHVTGWHAEAAASTAALLDADGGDLLGFTRVVATRPAGA
jgi:SAM-dependent methyltransferase